MAIKKDAEEIWLWYLRFEDFLNSNISLEQYCRDNKLDSKKWWNINYRINYKKHSDPALYEKLLMLGKQYINSDITAKKFAADNDISPRHLSEIVTHIRYLAIIESKLQEKTPNRMKFIQVPAKLIPSTYPNPPESEVIEKQNDIEIIISKGVKVSISPNIDSMKIIKIIELLKDL